MKKNYTLLLAICILSISQSIYAQCNNLLTNGNADAGLTGWTFSTGSGATWAIQNNTYGSAFVASYNWSTMSQQIDLMANGYTATELDQEPVVSFMQMYIGHTVNFADLYYFEIELLDASQNVITSYTYGSQGSPITTTNTWDTVSGSFQNYGAGLRYIRVECGGNDAEFWAGNYGTVIDNSIVSLEQIENVQICSGTYTFNNQTLSTSGTYIANFPGQFGCDSNVLLNLVVGGYNMHDTFQFCMGDTFIFNGQPITNSDTVSFAFTSVAGCDSIVNYVVNFAPSYSDSQNVNICPGSTYLFGNQFLQTPGVYNATFTTSGGCDSTVTLNLGFYPTDTNMVSAILCDGQSYIFGNDTITEGGIFNETFVNVYGCDSTVTLTLNESDTYNLTVNKTLCNGETYQFGSTEITESGTYNNVFMSSGGCDSAVTLNIDAYQIDNSVHLNSEANTLSSNEVAANATYQWLDCRNGFSPISGAILSEYTAPSGGRFALAIAIESCRDTSACITISPLGSKAIGPNRGAIIYPNPANHSFAIDGLKNAQEIKVYNALGQTVYQATTYQGNQINLSNWEVGIYTVYLKSDDGFQTLRLSVQH